MNERALDHAKAARVHLNEAIRCVERGDTGRAQEAEADARKCLARLHVELEAEECEQPARQSRPSLPPAALHFSNATRIAREPWEPSR